MTFEEWLDELRKVTIEAELEGKYVDGYREWYREYYDDKLTPEEAFRETWFRTAE